MQSCDRGSQQPPIWAQHGLRLVYTQNQAWENLARHCWKCGPLMILRPVTQYLIFFFLKLYFSNLFIIAWHRKKRAMYTHISIHHLDPTVINTLPNMLYTCILLSWTHTCIYLFAQLCQRKPQILYISGLNGAACCRICSLELILGTFVLVGGQGWKDIQEWAALISQQGRVITVGNSQSWNRRSSVSLSGSSLSFLASTLCCS